MRAVLAALALGASGCVPAGLDGYALVVEGAAVDGSGAPLADVEVVLVDSLGEAMASTSTDSGGAWSLALVGESPLANVLRVRASLPGYADGWAQYEVNLLSAEVALLRGGPTHTWEPVVRTLAPLRLVRSDELASVSARLVTPDGAAAAGIPGILQRGWNADIGAASEGSFTTDESGRLSAAVAEPGLYTAYVPPTGEWAGARFPVMAAGSAPTVTACLGPLQEPGELLATLLWTTGADLDLHLTAPDRSLFNSRFHVWAGDAVHPENVEEGEAYAAQLVRAAGSGPGPEVGALSEQAGEGELRMYVVAKAAEGNPASTVLGESGALLQWWNGEDIPRFAWASPLAVGAGWKPVEIDTRSATVYTVEAALPELSGEDPDGE